MGQLRQMRVTATGAAGATGATADTSIIRGEIVSLSMDVTGNSMDINLDTLDEQKAQAILDYTGNTDTTFYPETPMMDYQGSAIDVSDGQGGDTAKYGKFVVFSRLRLTLASAAAAETVTIAITYRD